MDETYDLFLLTSEWVDEGDNHELRFYGKSDSLGPVELIFDETKPVFFVDREEILPNLEFEYERKPVKLTTMAGRPVDGLYFRTWRELSLANERFRATGVRHYEADVRPDDRFLMERFINGMARISGEYEQKERLAVFRNPKIKAGQKMPELVIASIDIETGVASGELYSIAGHISGPGRDERRVFMLSNEAGEVPEENLLFQPTQKGVLQRFFEWFAEMDPDIIIGWHVVGFDLMYLERKCREFGLELDMARSERRILLVERPGIGNFATISGRVVIDGPLTMRNNGFTFPNYKLETVARSVLQMGKLIASDHNKIAEIERQFRDDKISLARYNIEDCTLVTDIYKKVNLLELLIQRTRFSGMLLDQLGITNAAFDHYYLPKLHRLGMVAPNAEPQESAISSAWDLAPRPGIYQNVVALDLSNMYACLVRIFKIEPLAHRSWDVDTITAPGGYRFSNSRHLLPYLLERLMFRQAEARKMGNAVVEKATTIQLRNICKVLHAKTSRFYETELSSALQNVGQWLARESLNYLEEQGYQVIRADEDALFVALRIEDAFMVEAAGANLSKLLDDYWRQRLEQEFGVVSELEIRTGEFFNKFVQPEKTAADGRKTYAGFNGELVFQGMDNLISDWTELGRNFLENLFTRFFNGDDLEGWLMETVKSLKAGDQDLSLVYRKRIKKDVNEYAKNAPAHIRAARMLEKPGREVNYLWTKRGPVPKELNPNDLDYEHYVQKQLQPLADILLPLLGKSFKSITEPEQISLF